MNVYLFQGDLICPKCAKHLKDETGNGWESTSGDSEVYPQGPIPNGGGEADEPKYCAMCECFLENLLTEEGLNYLMEIIYYQIEKVAQSSGAEFSAQVVQCAKFYQISLELLLAKFLLAK